MIRFNVIAFTHSSLGLDEIGKLHLQSEKVVGKMNELRAEMEISEIMYLSTCNRVEFVFVTSREVDHDFIILFLKTFNPEWHLDALQNYTAKAKTWNGINAVNHLIEVASSVDSMVIGEREIITQVRNAYEFAKQHGLSGDIIRLAVRQAIETAKRVYTETTLATKPVSVVSLAYNALKELDVPLNARVVVVGSGVTNTNVCRFLVKHGYRNYTIYNRTPSKAAELGRFTRGEVKPLSAMDAHTGGFDILVTCTGSEEPVITLPVYSSLLGSDKDRKAVIDLAIPADTDPAVVAANPVNYISVAQLKTIADANLSERRKELIRVRQIIYEAVEDFKDIFKMRQVELRMRSIPEQVKEIRSKAVNQVFSRELSQLDAGSKEVLEKILNYMEKKYISVPMLIAREMLVKNEDDQYLR